MKGFLRKMSSRVPDDSCSGDQPVEYSLRLDEYAYSLNPLISSTISLVFTGRIKCLECGRETKKSFNQGYCYPCFKRLAQCDLCIVSPDRCHFDQGTCRDTVFASDYCMQPHIVYLAYSSSLKVGITKAENLPTRWIDQGAVSALPIFKVLTRQQSGFVEVACKKHVSDRTHWQKMLKTEVSDVDLLRARDELMNKTSADLDDLKNRFSVNAIQPITNEEVQTFSYPVTKYPTKVSSLSFEKTPEISGRLNGMKGQYLIFDHGVINLRRFAGYEIVCSLNGALSET